MSGFTQLAIDSLIASLATDGEHVDAHDPASGRCQPGAHLAACRGCQPSDVLASDHQMSDAELNELLDFFTPGPWVDTSWHTDQMREWEQQAVERYLAEVALRESL